MRRPGGHDPSIQPISVTMLGSLIGDPAPAVRRQRRDDPRHVAGEDVG